jgi:hypothetical protein
MYTALGILFVLLCLPVIRWVVRAVSSNVNTVVDAPPEFEISSFAGQYLAHRLPEANVQHDQRWNKKAYDPSQVYDQEKDK